MTRPTDPVAAAHAAKETATLLREVRALLRRVDNLAAAAENTEPPTPALVTAARDAVEHLVRHLVHQEHTQHQRARQAIQRGKG